MTELTTDPFFLLGVVAAVAGIGGVGVKAFGIEIGAVTPARSASVLAAGLVIMGGAWWAADAREFEVTGLAIWWRDGVALGCDSVKAFDGAIETVGDPRPITYRVSAGGTVLVEGTFTPSGAGRTPISGQARVYGHGLPDLTGGGLGLYIEILDPVHLRSQVSTLGSLPDCGAMLAEPLAN
jgi:hypothetical protein